ncbi:hypothetical protein AB1N83_010672 [Pleurotus pulmonarius]
MFATNQGLGRFVRETILKKHDMLLDFTIALSSGAFNDNPSFIQLLEVMTARHQRQARGRGFQNMRYASDFDQFCHELQCVRPEAYRLFSSKFGGRSERSMLKLRSSKPKMTIGISDATLDRVIKYLNDYDYPSTAPLACSVDDTKLHPSLRPYYDKSKDSWYLLGSTGDPIIVADVEQLKELIQQTSGSLASKARVWTMSIPLSNVPPLVMAILPISESNTAASLEQVEEKLLRLLLINSPTPINIISLGSDGTVIERNARRLLVDSGFAKVEYTKIPHPEPREHPLKVEILVIGKHRLAIIQDSKHFRKTCRNNLFTGAKQLILGNQLIYYQQVRSMVYDQDHSPLYVRDVDKLDHQDDRAAARLFSAANIEHAINSGHAGLAIFLFVFGEACDAYQSRTINHTERIRMVLLAYFFKTLWKSCLAENGYSPTRHYLSHEADDILDIMMIPKLNVRLMAACQRKVDASDMRRGGAGYAHTHFDGSGADLESLACFPSQETFEHIAGIAWTEANTIWEVLGYFRGSSPTSSLPLVPIPDLDVDIDDALDEPTTGLELESIKVLDRQILDEALQAAAFTSVPPSDIPDLPKGVEDILNECGLAAAALNIRDLASVDRLPDDDPDVLQTLQATLKPILAAIAALGPEGQAAVNELMKDATEHSPVHAPVEDEEETPSILTQISQYDLTMLVDERRAHQSKETVDACRRLKPSPITPGSPRKVAPMRTIRLRLEKKEQSPRQLLASKIRETLKESGVNIKGETSGLARQFRWTKQASSTAVPDKATGNAANARRAANSRAASMIKSRKAIFAALPVSDSLSTANISPFFQLMSGSCAIVLYEKKLMLGQVVTFYEKGGDKASTHAWVSNASSIGTISWISMRLWVPLTSRNSFRSSTRGALPKYGLVHSKALLYAVQPKEITFLDNGFAKLSPTVYNSVFRPLNSKEGLVVVAVKKLMGRKHTYEADETEN